jgi:predicted ArsR family transcriptional regulator
MEALTDFFHPSAEIIAEFKAKHSNHVRANQETIFSMLQRRPCTADQIADVFDMHLNEVSKYLGKLIRTGQIRSELKKRTVYYLAVNRKEKDKASKSA